MHFLALEAHLQQYGANLRHNSMVIWCDNLPAVAWTYKFHLTTHLATRILQAFVVRLQHTQLALVNIQHILGIYNLMADVASRSHY